MTGPEVRTELVPVYVPRHLLAAVHVFIARENERQRVGTEVAGPDGSETSATHRISRWLWGEDDFRLLRRDRRPSTARMIAVLDALAAAPDTPLSVTRLCELTGLTWHELRGAFSGFTRVCRTLRADGQRERPFLSESGPPNPRGSGRELHYTMPSVLAERWRASGCGRAVVTGASAPR